MELTDNQLQYLATIVNMVEFEQKISENMQVYSPGVKITMWDIPDNLRKWAEKFIEDKNKKQDAPIV